MGCVSSVLFPRGIRRGSRVPKKREFSHHVVSLTSTTYGVLNLDKPSESPPREEEGEAGRNSVEVKKTTSPAREQPSEIINAWELMEGLEEESSFVVPSKRTPKMGPFSREGFCRSPLKMFNQVGSPRKLKKIGGKENSPMKIAVKGCNNFRDSKKNSPKLWSSSIIRGTGTPNSAKSDSFRFDSGVTPPSRRRSLGPLFDPELLNSFEKELSAEQKIASRRSRSSHDSASILNSYKKKCPPGGESAVILYTTTLRGIRKTFEECNLARSIIESQDVQMFERDISMDSGYRQELKSLMGGGGGGTHKNIGVPLLFIKGRLIGGVEEILKLEDNGKLAALLEGIPPAPPDCRSCGGIRFLMCVECNGSCKVLEEGKTKSRKCSKCNENGLIQCPFCC
ncbi:hypothetical protein M569_10691 [Genlisea aurea]|uniref:Glutaredoxin domain-containing protein n=1 Tax=Genlisea aurea TaxID=192259 RepID=S8CB48_9LAMI|nr:hypothetical protein M569_10691 [Genlisea aurea]